MDVDKVGLIGIPLLTSATGEGVMPLPGGSDYAHIGFGGEGRLRVLQQLGRTSTRPDESPGSRDDAQPKVTGVVRDSAGAPLAGVELVLWPPYRAASKGATTDSERTFRADLEPAEPKHAKLRTFLIARDFNRNLALRRLLTSHHQPGPAAGAGPGGYWPCDRRQGQVSDQRRGGDHVLGRAHGRHVGQAHPG